MSGRRANQSRAMLFSLAVAVTAPLVVSPTVVAAQTTVTTIAAGTNAPAAPNRVASVAPSVDDRQATSTVNRVIASLLILGGLMLAMTIWFFRSSRPLERPLEGLDLISGRRWLGAPEGRRDRMLANFHHQRGPSPTPDLIDPVVPGAVLPGVGASIALATSPTTTAAVASASTAESDSAAAAGQAVINQAMSNLEAAGPSEAGPRPVVDVLLKAGQPVLDVNAADQAGKKSPSSTMPTVGPVSFDSEADGLSGIARSKSDQSQAAESLEVSSTSPLGDVASRVLARHHESITIAAAGKGSGPDASNGLGPEWGDTSAPPITPADLADARSDVEWPVASWPQASLPEENYGVTHG